MRCSPPPHFPPDPPDPSPALSPHLFPPLASTPPNSRSEIHRSHLSPSLSDTVMTQALDSSPAVVISETTNQLGGLAEIEFQITIPATENPTPFVTSEISNSSHSLEQLHLTSTISDSNNLKIIISKHNSPLITNRASQNHALAVSTKSTHPLAECVAPPTCSPIPITLQPPVITSPILPTPSSSATQNLAEKLRVKGDKSLKRLAPITLSKTGRPRVLIHDSVFKKGDELHKDFIVCYFNG